MELNLYLGEVTLMDLTSGGMRDPFEIFRVGKEMDIEPAIGVSIDKVEILKEATPSIEPLNDSGLYRIVARILGGYARILTPKGEFQCPDGKEETFWGEVYLAVDFGVVSRLILNVPVPCRVCRESENSFVYVPIEEKLTEKMTFRRGEYVRVTGWLSPVFVDFWQAAIIVRSFRGIIRGFRTLDENRGVHG